MLLTRIRKFGTWLAAILILFTLVGFFVLPPVIKSLLVKKLSQNLNRPVTVQEVKVNPFSLTVRIGGLTVKEKAGGETFFQFGRLLVGLDPSSAVRRALILRRVELDKPYLRMVRHKDESYNFSDLLEAITRPAEASNRDNPFRFSVSNIQLTDGSLDFVDGVKVITHNIRKMKLSVPFASNIPHHANVFVQPYFSATINGSNYVLEGKTKPFQESYESHVDVGVEGMDLARYVSYMPLKLNLTIISALLDVNARLSFMSGENPSFVVSGTVTLSDVALDDPNGRSLARLPSTVVVVQALEPFKRSIHISNILLKSPYITLRRMKNGSIEPAALFNSPKEPSRDSTKPKDRTDPEEDGNVFSYAVDDFSIEAGTGGFEDYAFDPHLPITLKNLSARATGISSTGKDPGKVSLSFDIFRKGTVNATGTLGVTPLSLDLALDLKNIYISPFQPYLQEKVGVAITRGTFSGSGRLFLEKHGPSEKLQLTYNGDLFLSNFSSIDKTHGNPLLEWKNLAFSKIDARLEPLRLHVGGVALTDFYSRIIVNPDGSTNLQNVMTHEEQPGSSSEVQPGGTSPEPTDTEGSDIQIKTITVQGGRVDFSDKRIRPSYETELSELAGRVSDISVKKGGIAQLEVLGKIEKHIPLKIIGTINPSPKTLFVDLTASFRDLDVSPMTPYSAKYAGYTIEKGKLSLDVKYLINNRKLDSRNLIFLDQFTFGDRVESPDATGLPVRLAVALLKDRNGQIKLDIPVSGSIDDPTFRIGRIILQIIVNLITKAATSPFALIGSLFGGGEELGYVEFDFGSSRIDESGMKKIETLARALYERPSLKLDVEGRVDGEQDREALRQNIFTRKIRAQKLNEMIKQRLRPVAVEDIRIDAEEYDKYLEKAYNAEKFPKPRNVLGLTKTIPSSEMEKLMLTNIIVKDEDLRALANQRAMGVAGALLKSNVSAERVFVNEPKLQEPVAKNTMKESRVDFRLK